MRACEQGRVAHEDRGGKRRGERERKEKLRTQSSAERGDLLSNALHLLHLARARLWVEIEVNGLRGVEGEDACLVGQEGDVDLFETFDVART